jgi:hypothetical protein
MTRSRATSSPHPEAAATTVIHHHRETVVIAGALAQRPGVGGHAWVFANWVLGLQALGYRVVFVDRLEPEMLGGRKCAVHRTRQWRWASSTMSRLAPATDVALLYDRGRVCQGMSRRQLNRRCRGAIAVFNFMGYIDDPEVLGLPDRRVFVDIDPGFPQLWRDLGLADVLAGHDAYVTVGLNLGAQECTLPTCGIDWVPTVPPVALDRWPVREVQRPDHVFTSVCTWRGPWAPVHHGSTTYGLRAHQARGFVDLPRRAPWARFELALDIDAADRADADLLRSAGWRLVDPRRAAGQPERFQSYIQRSSAELLIAKDLYVRSRGGWVSDRSACYLASGRPVVAQDTGASSHVPTGEGLLAFSTLDEAESATADVVADYRRHAKAARALAAEVFDAPRVMGALLSRLGLHQ